MNVTLFTIGCPRCKILEAMLDNAGITYAHCPDKDLMIDIGIDTVPVLSVDGKRMQFEEAKKWIEQEAQNEEQ